MAKYRVVFVLSPPSAFGLPEEGLTLIASGTREVFSATIDLVTGTKVSHGTVSQFRSEPVDVQLALRSAVLHLHDNFLSIELSADSDIDAVLRAKRLANQFCVGLSVKRPQCFHAVFHSASNEDTQSPVPPSRAIHLGTMCFYSTAAMCDAANSLVTFLDADDIVLERASAYFRHGAFLIEQSTRFDEHRSFHSYYTFTEAILNFYKSMSVIVGDPACRDKHQSQYKAYGITRELWRRTEKIRKARGSMDVAHYKSVPEKFEEIINTANEARIVASEVITAYVAWLASRPKDSEVA